MRIKRDDPTTEYMLPDECIEKLNISSTFFYKLLSTRRIPGSVRIGNTWRIHRIAFEKFLRNGGESIQDLEVVYGG